MNHLSSEGEQWCTPILIFITHQFGQICLALTAAAPSLPSTAGCFLYFSFIDSIIHPSIHSSINFFVLCQWSIDRGESSHLHQRQQQDQPAIIVITVCAYIGLLCFVPHLPSSAGSLSSNLPVITNSRQGNRRKNLEGGKKWECG